VATYQVEMQPDETGAWTATLAGLPRVHAYAGSLSEAQSLIREALAVWDNDAEHAQLYFRVRLPGEWQGAPRDLSPTTRTRTRAIWRGDARRGPAPGSRRRAPYLKFRRPHLSRAADF
jgi:predicted RNase H-like HicB family nuclease